MTKSAITKNTKRGTIKNILDRKKLYHLSDYSRIVSKKIGRFVSCGEVACSMRNMKREGQIFAEFSGNGSSSKVFGYTMVPIH